MTVGQRPFARPEPLTGPLTASRGALLTSASLFVPSVSQGTRQFLQFKVEPKARPEFSHYRRKLVITNLGPLLKVKWP